MATTAPGNGRNVAVHIFTCVRLAGVAIVIVAALTGNAVWCWLAIPFVALTLWVSILVQFHYRRNLGRIPRLETPPDLPKGTKWPAVTLVVAARNEEDGIEAAVRSYMASDYPRLTVLVLDDQSTDNTPAVLDELATEFPNLRVVHDPPRQSGWGGKGNAVWYAVHNLAPTDCTWVLTTDADVRLEPSAVRAAVAYAESLDLDYFTCVPCMEPKTLSEEFAVITASWSLAIAGAARQLKKGGRPIGLGLFAMFTRDLYVETGGHASFQGLPPEDMQLARVFREAGAKMTVGWTSGMVRVRHRVGYDDVRQKSVAKTRVEFDDSIPAVIAVIAYWLSSVVLPLPLGAYLYATYSPVQPLATVEILLLLTYVTESYRFAGQRRFVKMRSFIPWLHPLAGLMRVWFSILAIWAIATHKPISWRGRILSGDTPDE